MIIFEAMLVPGSFPTEFNHPKHETEAQRTHPKDELEAGGQLVLQAASPAKSPKTMNTEIQRGLV